MAEKGSASTALFTSAAPGKPKGFIEAFAQIERYYELETQGSDIPEGLFTVQQKIEFWEVGFISTFWSSMFSIFLAPLAIGVIERHIPVFGGQNPTMADKFLVLMLALSFTIGYASFLGQLGRYYDGRYTKRMINSFMSGIILTAVLKIVVALILFHFLALWVFEPFRVELILLNFKKWVSAPTLIAAYHYIVEFRPVLLTSAWFVCFTTLAYIAVPGVSIIIRLYRDRRLMQKGGKKI